MTKRPVLILGGGSDIGLAIARRFAQEGHAIQLAARRPDELKPEQSDIALRYNVDVSLFRFDALETDHMAAFFNGLPDMPGVVVCAVGLLGDQQQAENDPDHAQDVLQTNFVGPIIAIEAAARRLAEASEPSAIIVLSSVAGDRGRAKNYWYGASKAALTAALSGLRQKYVKTPVQITTIKPGFVNTRMLPPSSTPGLLTVEPQAVAEEAYAAYRKRKDVVYVGLQWKIIMLIIRTLPEFVFKRLKF